jgi:PAS domain-containing protein
VAGYKFLKENSEGTAESEIRYRGIFNNAAVGIFQVDIKEHFVAVNNYICGFWVF